MDRSLLLSPAEIERRVFAWLQGRPPATPDDWATLGSEGMKRLFAIAVTPRSGNRANRLRSAALGTLGQIGEAEHVDPLLEVFDEPDLASIVRCGAIEGLGHLGLPRALPLLQSQAFHADFRVRLYAVGALARMPKALTRRVLQDVAMRDPHTQVRRAATVELDRMAGKSPVAVGSLADRRQREGVEHHVEVEGPEGHTLDDVDAVTLEQGDATESWAGDRAV
jgi:hypothetical protein